MFDTYEGAYSEESDTNNSFHPLTRTPRIVGVGEPSIVTDGQKGSSVVSCLVVIDTNKTDIHAQTQRFKERAPSANVETIEH